MSLFSIPDNSTQDEITQADLIIGTDEVGRGCIFGPVVAAAVILDPENPILGITDSKKLSPKKRALLADQIKLNSLAYAIIEISSQEIDQINILQASIKAMALAVEQCFNKIKQDKPNLEVICLVDGNQRIPVSMKSFSIIKGDLLHQEIGAASILAKVYRDDLISAMAQEDDYNCYDLQSNKGYPTAKHLDSLQKYGVSLQHRRSFAPIMRLLNKKI